MSFEMTFRQKLIRIACSSAICGLSLSFMTGEAVDQKAKLLRSWVPDPSIIPQDYLPVQPAVQALEQFHYAPLETSLIVQNSGPAPELAALDLPRRTLLPLPTFTPKDDVMVIAAAPERSSPVVANPQPVAESQEIPAGDMVIEGTPQKAEVAKAPVTLHELPMKVQAPVTMPSGVVVADADVHAARTSPERSPVPVPSTPKRNVSAAAMEGPWKIHGQVLSTTAPNNEAGHYEVGLYAKVDNDQHPIGFPVVQQILPAGQTSFRLHVPAKIEQGYLFAEFVAAKSGGRSLISPASNPWKRGNTQVAELFLRDEDSVVSTAAAVFHEQARDQWRVQGNISTMFAPANTPIYQDDVVVKVRGRKESTRTDSKGNFTLDLPRAKGTLYLEVLKAGYHPTIVSVNANDTKPVNIVLASRHAIDQIAQRLGISQGSTKGVFIGRAISTDGSPLRGITALLSVKADGPFYFDEEGQPSRDGKATASDGRFLFLNVEAGVAYVDSALNGEPIAPFAISTVEGGELVQKSLQPVSGILRGRLFNPVSAAPKLSPVSGARVRVEGSTDYVTTDSYGAFSIGPVRWMKGEKVAIEFSAERFNNHRYLVNANNSSLLNLYAFPATYISRLAQSMDVDLDPYAGIVMGKVTGLSVRVDALADHSPTNSARDFYFDPKGRLRGSHEMTDPRFGTYMILNVPKGRAILQGSDASGQLKYSEAIHSSPSSVSVVMD